MEIYKPIALQAISLLFLLFFLIFSGLKKSKWLTGATLFLLFVLLLLLFVQRDYSANIDLPRYMGFYDENVHFSDLFKSSTAWKGDYFFFGIMPIAHMFGLDEVQYVSFQTGLAIALTFLAYFKFFRGHGPWLFLALFFMINSSSFYLIHGNVIRQGLASSLLLLALVQVSHAKGFWLKVLAFFSHKGSVFGFFPFLTPKTNDIRAAVILSAFVLGFFSVFVHVLPMLPLPGFILTKIDFYGSFERASSNSLLKLLLLLCFNVLFLYFGKKEGLYKKFYETFFVFSIVAFLLFRFDGMFSRLVLYTDIFLPILTVGMLQKASSKKQRLWVLFLSVLVSLLYSFYVFNHESILFNMGTKLQLF